MALGAQTVGEIAVYGSATQLGIFKKFILWDNSDTVVEFDSDRWFFPIVTA